MGKIIFFDVDGTLIGKSQVIANKNKEALSMLRKKVIKSFYVQEE